ncbi:hypothetical protein N9Y89_01895, partial [bacterium]|nr:hypothetical protein [bacterium]
AGIDVTFDSPTQFTGAHTPILKSHTSEIFNLHDYARKFVQQDISTKQTLPIAKAILELGIKNAKIDLGKLAFEWIKAKETCFLLE